MLGTGNYLILPGRDRHDDSPRHGAALRPRRHRRPASHGVGGSALGLTPYQVITAASVVEKEGYIPVNMPERGPGHLQPSGQGTPLQMDSTVLYAFGQDGGPVTAQDLQIQSPYNTYLNTGLTPTPDLHARRTHALVGGRSTRRRVPGCTSSWCRRTA